MTKLTEEQIKRLIKLKHSPSTITKCGLFGDRYCEECILAIKSIHGVNTCLACLLAKEQGAVVSELTFSECAQIVLKGYIFNR